MIIVPNPNDAVLTGGGGLIGRLTQIDDKIDLINHRTSDIESFISILTANPNHPDHVLLLKLKEVLVIYQSLSGMYKTWRQEIIDQIKWETQEAVKQTLTLSKT